MTYRQKAVKYGRDYIRNFKTYESFVKFLRYEENLQKRIEEGDLIEDTNPYNVFEEHMQREIDIETGEIINDHKKSEG